jgi:hypothetical protein
MRDLEKALTDIQAVRSQIARGTAFHGYGPVAFAATGILALTAAALQSYAIDEPRDDIAAYLALWIAAAMLSTLIIGIDVVTRSRRAHSGLANEMVQAAAEQLIPSLVVGALLSFVVVRFAPQSLWMLPGLWQIVLSLGIFASCRLLPAPFIVIGIWYLGAGLACLALTDDTNALSPWMMGLPFGVGQLLAAIVIRLYGPGQGAGYGQD